MLKREAAPLRVQAVEHLRERIVSGVYFPGFRLTEKSLEEALGVSRTVVREALRQLESERLIELRPNVGPVVRTLTYPEAVNLYEVRAALEALAGRLAAGHSNPRQIENLRDILATISNDTGRSLTDTLGLKNAFYNALVDASGNPIIGELLDNVQARISQLRAVSLQHAGRTPVMVAELTRIVDAIEAGDADAADCACHEHVQAASLAAIEPLATPTEAEGVNA